jgi:HEAT repeat protein
MEEKYLTELIQRMIIKEEIKSSDSSISWKAYREAETLTDTSSYPILKNLILQNSKPKDKKYRNAAYFIMGKLLKKTPINEFIDFYLQQMEVETDKYILSSMLDLVADIIIPINISTKILGSLAMNEKWLIRHSAISALCSSTTSESKQALYHYINQADEKTYRYEIIYANASLGKIGSVEDIPTLNKHIKSKINDIRYSAEYAIKSIQERAK